MDAEVEVTRSGGKGLESNNRYGYSAASESEYRFARQDQLSSGDWALGLVINIYRKEFDYSVHSALSPLEEQGSQIESNVALFVVLCICNCLHNIN